MEKHKEPGPTKIGREPRLKATRGKKFEHPPPPKPFLPKFSRCLLASLTGQANISRILKEHQVKLIDFIFENMKFAWFLFYEEKVNHLLVVSTPLEQKTLETFNQFESGSLSPFCLTGQRNV